MDSVQAFYATIIINMLDLAEEKKLFSLGYDSVGGVDEAGRGPLAGPVVAACVLIDKNFSITDERLKLINDSKKLTEKKRNELFEIITNKFPFSIGISDNQTIDRINVLEATFLAMKKAISGLKIKPDFILIDGNLPISNSSIKQKPIINGDGLVFSIAAASIIAKVTRDKIMMEMHEKYPQYCFDRHKGYGTKLHMDKLNKFGPSPIHRKSYAPVNKLLQK